MRMNPLELKDVCRTCLDENVALNWNATLYGYPDITYKDCFYKYTPLECIALDPYSSMLCQFCLNSLYNLHTFVLKALEAQKYFEDTWSSNLDIKDIKYTPTEFETVLVEKIEVEPAIEDQFAYEHFDEELYTKPAKSTLQEHSKQRRTNIKATENRRKCKTLELKTKTEKYATAAGAKVSNSEYNIAQSSTELFTKSRLIQAKYKNNFKKLTVKKESAVSKNQFSDDNFTDHGEKYSPKVRKKYKEVKKPRMCSICSKILQNKYAVQMHEKTHMENRERKETCKVCGLKFYDKRNLYSHNRIHKENREKSHKCEFCNKAFYDKGGLNIHRRIHLGQMIPCSLCSKQYFRQIDLERHMSTHSATAINSETKKRSRYYVRCKHCDKSILSTSFKSHTAAHLNEPLMKCSICSKEFFRRGSCVLHVKKTHKKSNQEYNDFIILYKKNRISHLFLEQKADIQYSNI